MKRKPWKTQVSIGYIGLLHDPLVVWVNGKTFYKKRVKKPKAKNEA